MLQMHFYEDTIVWPMMTLLLPFKCLAHVTPFSVFKDDVEQTKEY